MSAKVVSDKRKAIPVIARFLDDDGNVPKAPHPAFCLILNGTVKNTYTVGQERDLLEAYFRMGAE